ncbi:hypothetical protein ACEQPO_26720 [Bacillus sp. SL00103]
MRAGGEAEGTESFRRLKKRAFVPLSDAYTTPNAERIIASFQHEQDLIVDSCNHTSAGAISHWHAGSQFIVSPGYLPIIEGEHLSFHDTLYVPGVLTQVKSCRQATGYCL